jgi:hypothetical protein
MSNDKFQWISGPDPLEWNCLVETSFQGSLFNESIYLYLADVEYEQYLIKQGSHIKAGVCVVKGENSRECKLDDLVIHNGIFFLPDPQKKQVKQRFEQFELTEFAIEQLTIQFDIIELALSPQFEDLRPFIWHGYHAQDNKDRFALDLRYTSYVDISSLRTNEAIETSDAFLALETLRKRHIRQAQKNGGMVRQAVSGKILIDFYRDLLIRQGETPPEEKLVRMRHLVDGLVAVGRGAVYEVQDSAGMVIYAVAYGWDSKRAYYLFGSGHPVISKPWQGTLAHWEAFKDLSHRIKIKEVDMEGVNSPQRGWFKLGFGGDLRSYYQVYKGVLM